MRIRRLTRLSTALFVLGAVACGGSSTPATTASNSPAKTVVPPMSSTPSMSNALPSGSSSASATPAAPPPVDPDVSSGDDAKRDGELTAEAGKIFDAFYDVAPHLTADGSKVVFKSNRDGIPQLYVGDVNKPDGKATRLVTTTERIGEFELTPDGKSVLFQMDKGADENWSIYKIGVDGSGLTELTKGEQLHRDRPFVPTNLADTMFYSARPTKEKSTRLYAQSLADGGVAKVVYTDPSPAFLIDVSPDGKSALLVRLSSLSDSKVVLVDLGNGTGKTIWPAEGKTEGIGDAAFSADGAQIYVATDAGGEQAVLVALDAKSLTEKARYVEQKPKTARLDQLSVPRKGDKLALFVDAGNHAELRIVDAKTLKAGPAIAMPLGSGGGMHMSDDGKTLAVHWSTPSTPPEVFAIDVATGKSHALRKEERPFLKTMPVLDATITEITSFDGTKVPVNLYLPKPMPPKGKKLPTIVIVHGGPAGSYEIRWSLFNRFFSSHGFAIVEPNVRGSTGFGRAYEQADDYKKRLDAVKDLEEVGKWANKQTWADPDRLVLMGGSYGGYMTLMGVTNHPTLWKAGVDLFGIYSWKAFMTTTAGVIRDIFQKEIGPETDPAFLDSISPAANIDKVVAPLFVYAGQNDPRVPRSESDSIVKNLRDRKIPVEYMVAANEGHSLDRKENVTGFLGRAERFLETKLKIGK